MKIIKRNGELQEFNKEKVRIAIIKACDEVDDTVTNRDIIDKIVLEIAEENKFQHNLNGQWLTVENISDMTEDKLMTYNLRLEAKRYILYRQERKELRDKGWDMTQLQKDVLHKKYFQDGETFNDFVKRVGNNDESLMKAIRNKEFLFAGRVLDGRGSKDKKTYSNCFVVPTPEDSIDSIFDVGKRMAKTFSLGGGVGVDISKLRPNGSRTNNSAKESTGSVSFGSFYSFITGLIGQKARRGALMLTLDINHPDIKEFITVKSDLDKLTKANISVKITDEFMEAVKVSGDFETKFVVNHDNGEVDEISRTYNARKLFDLLAKQNYDFGEPGVLFWDRINNWYLLSEDDDYNYDSTNPCFRGDMKLLTEEGYRTFESLNGKNDINLINKDGDITTGRVWCSGEKKISEIRFFNRSAIYCTEDHVFMNINGEEIKAKDLKGERLMPSFNDMRDLDETFVKLGFIQGDGRLKSDNHSGLEIYIGEDDRDVAILFNAEDKINKEHVYYTDEYTSLLEEWKFKPLPTVSREFPENFSSWSIKRKKSFLSGLFSANGCVIDTKSSPCVSFKTVSEKLKDDLQKVLEDLGLHVTIYKNTARNQEFSNGTHLMKSQFEVKLNRYEDMLYFYNNIGFIHDYKNKTLEKALTRKSPVVSTVEDTGTIEKVYDFTEPGTHWGVVEGVIAHNCAEKPLPANSNCLLGSLNLSTLVENSFTHNAKFNYKRFKELIRLGIRQLNIILDEGLERLPYKENIDFGKDYRPIGLGYFGYGNMLIRLGLRYGSEEAIEFTHKIGDVMIKEALKTSALLAKENGSPYPRFKKEEVMSSPFFKAHANQEITKLVEEHGLFNAELLSIAPTGSISILAGTSSGIEPLYRLSYTRKTETIGDGDEFYTHREKIVDEYMEIHNISDENKLPNYFVTANELTPLERVKTQSAWQHYVDASISSTVNLDKTATVEDVKEVYSLAWEHGLKGITVFRDGCKRAGILGNHDNGENDELVEKSDKELVDMQDKIDVILKERFSETDRLQAQYEENSDVCPNCGGELRQENGCEVCRDCSWSPCGI